VPEAQAGAGGAGVGGCGGFGGSCACPTGGTGGTGGSETGGTGGSETGGTGGVDAGLTGGTGGIDAGDTGGTGGIDAGDTGGTGGIDAGDTGGTGGIDAGDTGGTGGIDAGDTGGTGGIDAGNTGGSAGTGGTAGSGGAGGTGGIGGSGGTGGSGGGTTEKCNIPGPHGFYCLLNAGTFEIGSPTNELGRDTNEQKHVVALTRKFLIQSTEVTQDQWTSVMGSNPSLYSGCGGDCPVENVSWFLSLVYANHLSDLAGLARCYADPADGTAYDESDAAAEKWPQWVNGLDCVGYRLPTEAEWEYAARAGTKTAFFTGAITKPDCSPLDPNLDLAGWYCGNSENKTHPVKLKKANAWGLYDVHGNVWEWTWDAVSEYPTQKVTDPMGGPDDAYSRMGRGGAFYEIAGMCRAAVRSPYYPVLAFEGVGLRTARTHSD